MNINKNINVLESKKFKCFCSNCGEKGHIYQSCNMPITSVGIIAYYFDNKINDFKFLIIRRRDTLGYVDFMRGKYTLNNVIHIQNLFNEMTVNEHNKILNNTFEELWCELWSNRNDNIDYSLKSKFDTLKSGIKERCNIETFIENTEYKWEEPEWGFPKGRRNYNEKDYNAAIREFNEETGILPKYINIIQNIKPLEECFVGSNYKSYKHKYYLAQLVGSKPNMSRFQKSEVSEQGFFTKDEIILKFRSYNKERCALLEQVYNIVCKYHIQ